MCTDSTRRGLQLSRDSTAKAQLPPLGELATRAGLEPETSKGDMLLAYNWDAERVKMASKENISDSGFWVSENLKDLAFLTLSQCSA